MDEVTLVRESYNLILKDFRLEEDLELKEANMGHDWLVKFLTQQINYLLDHDFNRLLNALYRIDISENQTKEIIELTDPKEVAKNLAIAVIKREQQKVLTRQQFRESQ
jgi:hypothetical protein